MNRTELTAEHAPCETNPSNPYNPWVKTVCPASNVIDNNSERAIRAAAIQKSQAASWERDDFMGSTDDKTGIITVELTPSAKKVAQAAGEQAVNAWKSRNIKVAALQMTLENSQKDLAIDSDFTNHHAWVKNVRQVSQKSSALVKNVDQLNQEIANSDAAAIRAATILNSKAAAWERQETEQQINEETGNLTMHLTPTAIAAAEAAGEQAVDQWHAQKSELAAAQCGLNNVQQHLSNVVALSNRLAQQMMGEACLSAVAPARTQEPMADRTLTLLGATGNPAPLP